MTYEELTKDERQKYLTAVRDRIISLRKEIDRLKQESGDGWFKTWYGNEQMRILDKHLEMPPDNDDEEFYETDCTILVRIVNLYNTITNRLRTTEEPNLYRAISILQIFLGHMDHHMVSTGATLESAGQKIYISNGKICVDIHDHPRTQEFENVQNFLKFFDTDYKDYYEFRYPEHL